MTSKPMTHEQLVKAMLKNPAVKAEVERLNREEFALLDQILAARKSAGLSQADVADARPNRQCLLAPHP